nr:DUF423 domain-containing protein [Gellertiella hungarica]
MAAAAVIGLAGVALSAAAAHSPDPRFLTQAGLLCLAHGPALLAVAGFPLRLGRLAAALMIAGVALFSGDMMMREFGGSALFPRAAPTGGMMIMAGWFSILVGVAIPRKG